jgi:hypothetical protein
VPIYQAQQEIQHAQPVQQVSWRPHFLNIDLLLSTAQQERKKTTRRWFLNNCGAIISMQQKQGLQQPMQQGLQKQQLRVQVQEQLQARVLEQELLLFCHKQTGQQQR